MDTKGEKSPLCCLPLANCLWIKSCAASGCQTLLFVTYFLLHKNGTYKYLPAMQFPENAVSKSGFKTLLEVKGIKKMHEKSYGLWREARI